MARGTSRKPVETHTSFFRESKSSFNLLDNEAADSGSWAWIGAVRKPQWLGVLFRNFIGVPIWGLTDVH